MVPSEVEGERTEVRGKLKKRPFVFVILLVLPGTGFAAATGLEGTVLSAGVGATGVYIEVFNRLPDGLVSPVATTTSGESGLFTIQMPRGDYYVTARKRPSGTSSVGMLFGTSGDIPVPPIELDDRGGLGSMGEAGVNIQGSVAYEGSGLGGAFVYVYPGMQRRGPGYLARVRSAEDGAFSVKVPAGVYSITIRNSDGGDGMGSVQREDLVGEYGQNPIQVGQDSMMVGTVQLRKVDLLVWEKRRWAVQGAPLSVSGTIFNEEGSPVAGVYAFLYSDHRMVGKPAAISSPTGDDGIYEVRVLKPGSYYLGSQVN
jgi:hypothetical protein